MLFNTRTLTAAVLYIQLSIGQKRVAKKLHSLFIYISQSVTILDKDFM